MRGRPRVYGWVYDCLAEVANGVVDYAQKDPFDATLRARVKSIVSNHNRTTSSKVRVVFHLTDDCRVCFYLKPSKT